MLLPVRKHLVHKPVEVRNLSKKAQEGLDIFTNEWMHQIKYDGCHGIVIVAENGDVEMVSREGNVVKSCDHILKEFRHWMPGVYFGEVWHHDKEFSEISGLFRKQATTEKTEALRYVLFDFVTLDAFHDGEWRVRFVDRWDMLCNRYRHFIQDGYHVNFAFTCTGDRRVDAEDFVRQVQEGDKYETDGFVAKRCDGYWIAGAGSGGEQIKDKDHVSVDLRCVGLEMGQGKFDGMVGALLCEYKGEVITVGGGKLTTAERLATWQDKSLLVGQIVEVHGLKGSTYGVLREPRFQRIRKDKTEPSE